MQVLDLVEETVVLGSRELSVLRPSDPEALLDDEAFEHEEFLPYWAELWPSGIALAQHLTGLELNGVRVVELGCGLALPSFAAALGGAHVLATDWAPDAVELAGRNARRNGIALELAVAGWTRPGPLLEHAPFDLVLASDVLYERRNVPLLLYNLRRLAPEVLRRRPAPPACRGLPRRGGEGVGRRDHGAGREARRPAPPAAAAAYASGVIAATGDTALQIMIVLSIVVPLVVVGIIGWIFLKAARRDAGTD